MGKFLGVSVLAMLVASPALAETCVTGVTSTATNAVTSVNTQTGQVAGTVTPTFGNALTGVSAQTGQVVGSVTSTSANAVTGTPVTTTPITHVTDFTQTNVLGGGPFFLIGGSDLVRTPNPPGNIQNVSVIIPTATSTTNVVTAVNPTTAPFVNGVTTTPTSAVTGIGSTNAPFINGITTTPTNAVTGVTATSGQVVGSVAASSGATASAGSIGCGPGASANGLVSAAFGAMASANHDNATAIGAGATTTRANQVVVGTASNTYTMAGINSAASRAAQSGDVRFVTADSQGNLATADISVSQQSMLNLVNIATAMTDLQGRVSNLEQAVYNLRGDMDRANEGVAMAIAMGGGWLPDDKIFAISTNYGNFQSQSALAVSTYYRVSRNVVVNAGVGYGFRHNAVGSRVGALVAW